MPRTARKKSSSNIYHIILRGTNHQPLFEDDADCKKFLEILAECKEASGFSLYAYCLMGSHAHLLIQVTYEGPGQIFKRIGSRYVYWFNRKYGRAGRLFHDRFISEPVEDTQQLFATIRYIHQSPVKAQPVSTMEAYRWSSYREYLKKRSITDTSFALKMMPRDAFIRFNQAGRRDGSCVLTSQKQTTKLPPR